MGLLWESKLNKEIPYRTGDELFLQVVRCTVPVTFIEIVSLAVSATRGMQAFQLNHNSTGAAGEGYNTFSWVVSTYITRILTNNTTGRGGSAQVTDA